MSFLMFRPSIIYMLRNSTISVNRRFFQIEMMQNQKNEIWDDEAIISMINLIEKLTNKRGNYWVSISIFLSISVSLKCVLSNSDKITLEHSLYTSDSTVIFLCNGQSSHATVITGAFC